jgi:large-conductance mechanosensitive channel
MTGSYLNTVIGFLITGGNQIVYKVVNMTSDWVGFKYSTRSQNWSVVMYTVATFINAVLDMWMTFMIAKGQVLDERYKERVAASQLAAGLVTTTPLPESSWGDTILGYILPAATIETASAEQAFATQLYGYIFPFTVLVPLFAEPVVAFVFYKLAFWSVRSRTDCGPEHAQGALALSPFDFNRYADNLINIQLCILMLFVSSSHMASIWVYQLISILWVYSWDRYRVLRTSQATNFNMSTCEDAAQIMLCLPCGLLAGILVYRGFKLGWLDLGVSKDTPTIILEDNVVYWYIIAAVLLHFFVHASVIFMIQKVVKKTTDEEKQHPTYEEISRDQPANWFNTNPIHVLLSIYDKEEATVPLVYYQKGKEYLQGGMDPSSAGGLLAVPNVHDADDKEFHAAFGAPGVKRKSTIFRS